MAEAAAQAIEEGCGLAVMPECAVQGYLVQGANAELAMTAEAAAAALARRLPQAEGFQAVFGLYESSDGQPWNSAVHARLTRGRAEVIQVHRKFFLPTYGVFDEARYTQAGSSVGSREGIGVLICEDLWHSIMPALCALDGAWILAVPVASPGRGFGGPEPSNLGRYRRMLQAAAEEHGLFVVSSCLTGFESGKGLAGGSMIFDPFGEILAEAPILEEAMIVAELDSGLVRSARERSPLLRDLRRRLPDLLRQAARMLDAPDGVLETDGQAGPAGAEPVA